MISCSSETEGRLRRHVDLLEKWNKAINLVAASTLPDVWLRHVEDSAQLLGVVPESCRSWADLGSGAGFPGLVIAILAAEHQPSLHVTLVEADRRKATFLQTVARETGLRVTIIADRAENIPPLASQVVSARALAPISQLCAHAHRHLAPGGKGIFPKGASAEAEVDEARRTWSFDVLFHPSATDPSARIVEMSNMAHV